MNFNELEKNIFKIAEGDKNALRNIYDEFNYVVYNVALSILHNTQYAEDVSQEVFIKIWKYAYTFCPGKNPKAWIIEITRNQSIDALRKIKHEISIEEFEQLSKEYLPKNESLTEQVIGKINTEQLLLILPNLNREIFIMRAVGDLTYREISQVLKISIGKVVWNYKSSIKILSKQISKYGF